MHVDRFSSLEQLSAIESRWAELYESDPEATLFLSWEWMSACLSTEKRPWIVLGVRDVDLPHLAFLPLSFTRFPLTGRRLSLGPSPRSDFTGMLGSPGMEGRFIPALAEEIQRLSWDSLVLNNCADRRVAMLIEQFGSKRFRIVPGDPTPCPYIQLPATWEDYLNSRGRSTRKMIRSHLHRIQALPGYRLHFAPPGEAEAIETLLRFHSLRWKKSLAKSRQDLGDFLARCAAAERFVVCTIYQGNEVIAVQGYFVEQRRRAIVTYMVAHNPEYAEYSPGVMLVCESIRHAIEQGYGHYNFSRGDQEYKRSLSTGVQYLSNSIVWRRSVRAGAIDGGRRAFSATKGLARRVVRGQPARVRSAERVNRTTPVAAPAFRAMRFDDYDKIRALLLQHALETPAFEDWRHRWIANPLWQRLGTDAPIGWVLETAAGEIVGSMESIPTRYEFNGSDLIAGASAAWCAKDPYRGYALQLIDEYFNQSVDLLMMTTVGPNAVPILSRYCGPVPVGQWDQRSYFITEHVSFARRALQKYHVAPARLLAYPIGWGLSSKDALYNRALPEPPGDVLVESTDKFDSRFDDFWGELVRENREKLLAERSSRALWWHFDAAIRSNRLWILTATKSHRLRAYCILRKESTPDARQMSVIDYQSLDHERDLLPGFLHVALRRCAAEGFDVLQNVGVGVPKMRVFDEYAPYRRRLPNSVFFYMAPDATLAAALNQPRCWDPSLYDGDATL